ncbi:regulator of chromosome condensation 1/beta-lactamase-inhibitor protein II [Terfezia claveryi]|nr:regulator of chromosome condensation 1/beta-lactamase-inhibitor protein II [Terfezia claveryi]
MFPFRPATQTIFRNAVRPSTNPILRLHRNLSSAARPLKNQKGRTLAAVLGFSGAILAYQIITVPELHAETQVDRLPPTLYSQHIQVLDSWKHPGVYTWGNNKGRVVAPASNEDYIRAPRRIPFFNNILLRDLKLEKDVGLAVDEKGNVYEWGIGYGKDINEPEVVLAGKDIQRIEASADRIFALSKDGTLYSLPIIKVDQREGPKPDEPSWIPFTKSKAPVSYKTLKVPLEYFDKISDISAGRDHLLILTSAGHVYAAAASHNYPDKGQLGVPGLTWATRPKHRPYDSPFRVITVGNKISQIATGDYHSLLLDSKGRVWTFGDNSYGQLGFDYLPDQPLRDSPTELLLQGFYPGPIAVTCYQIAAGGMNSFYMVDATQLHDKKVTADVWASGQGLWGELGNGKWTHAQGKPTKIKALSGLVEYDDATNQIKPIRAAYIAAGAHHFAAVMDTKTNTKTTDHHEAFSGRDVLWWGNSEFFQLGNGRRNNVNVPLYIPRLDARSERPRAEAAVTEEQQIVPTDRLQVTPKQKTTLGDGRKAEVEQKVVAGRGTSGLYTKV